MSSRRGPGRSSMDTDLAQRARTVLDTERYLVLGTVDPDGVPRVSPVFFTHDGYRDLYWVSRPDTHHSTNLATWPWVSGVVYDSSSPVGEGRAVYLTGRAFEVPDGRAGAVLCGGLRGGGQGRPRLHARGAVRAGVAAALPAAGRLPRGARPRRRPDVRHRVGPPRRRGSSALRWNHGRVATPTLRRPAEVRVLRVEASWVWDFWLADDGDLFHLFFLKAPRDLDPDDRHWHAVVGHAVSRDLTDWVEVADALGPSVGPGVRRPRDLDRLGGAGRHRLADVLHRHRPRRPGPGAADRRRGLRRPDDVDPGLRGAGAGGRPAVVRHRRVRRRGVLARPVGVRRPGRRRLAPARDRPGRRRAARGRRRARARHLAGPAHLDGAAAAEPARRRLRPARGPAGRGRRRPAGAAVRLHDRRARPRAPGRGGARRHLGAGARRPDRAVRRRPRAPAARREPVRRQAGPPPRRGLVPARVPQRRARRVRRRDHRPDPGAVGRGRPAGARPLLTAGGCRSPAAARCWPGRSCAQRSTSASTTYPITG